MFTTQLILNTANSLRAMQLVVEAQAELLKVGYVDRHYGLEFRTETMAYLLLHKDTPVGIVQFYELNADAIYIALSYVKPRYRNRGGWKLLRDSVADYGRDNQKCSVFSGVCITNAVSMNANKTRGKAVFATFKEVL